MLKKKKHRTKQSRLVKTNEMARMRCEVMTCLPSDRHIALKNPSSNNLSLMFPLLLSFIQDFPLATFPPCRTLMIPPTADAILHDVDAIVRPWCPRSGDFRDPQAVIHQPWSLLKPHAAV